MDNVLIIIILIVFLAITVLMCLQESRKRKIGFVPALLICIVTTPLIGYIIISNFALRNPVGCQWCGNTKNEVEFCGVCGKNKEGEIRGEGIRE